MTRKDYVAIAQILATRKNIWSTAELARQDIAEMIADYMAGNPRFDRARFLKACGVQS